MLLTTLVVLVNLTPVQNYLARKAATVLTDKLKTKVSVAHVRIDFLNHLMLQGVYVEDQSHDTLLYAGELQLRITDWFIFSKKPVIHYVGLSNTFAHLNRKAQSKVWNYDFIADALGSGNSSSNGGSSFEFDLKKVVLENVRFHMDDAWGGEDLDFDVGGLILNAKDIDFRKKTIRINDIAVTKTDVFINEYKAGHPPRPVSAVPEPIDTTPFNAGKWVVLTNGLTLDGCTFHLTGDNKVPVPDLFDENHLAISNIKAAINTISIVGDTIRGNVTNLFAHERCGLEIRKMQSKVSVSPIASVCDELYMETNNSKIRNYYAMNYRRFPDFLEYIDSVVMVAHLRDASIDVRDIAYFATELKKFPNITVKANGDGRGTVANLGANNLIVSDGNSVFKGNITMKGLPDIYNTYITYTNGELLTNGKGILRYVPTLKNSPDVAFEQISYALFRGSYEGYIENFRVKGALKTNLGDIAEDIRLDIPGFNTNTAIYSGSITSDNVQVGSFLKQPLFGGISLSEKFSGKSFNPDLAQANIDGFIKELTLNDYAYHNISTKGLLARKQFNGTLLVDDPNLALEFDGGINYANKNVNIKATAHLLGSNFNALHLTKDTFTVSADFDLNCTGSNIDNFSGFAKLNNIDMKRNSHKVALDSVFVNATGDSLNKLLTVQSNNIMASISGDYQLSNMATSVQYYLSRYMPDYIKVPKGFIPSQDFTFKINTYNIDSIWAITFPLVKGFDSSEISGSLNTEGQKLTLNASIPNGTIGNIHMTNIGITGSGNLQSMGLNTTIDNVAINDSMLNGSLSVTTTVGSDSVAFTIATTTPDTSTSITLNGRILARKDSLFLTMLPSQFYLNQARWDISGGSKVVYSDKYLYVDGLSITSGLQRITASSHIQQNDQSIIINTENLDLGQLGTWAGLAIYQPDGRLNGTIEIDKVFGDLYVSSNMKATNVLLGNDTVGTVNVVCDYDGAKKLITFDPQTGIYRDASSIVVSGKVSFDSTTHQQLDGQMQFKNAPLAWSSPFLVGIMSHMTGTLNGTIKFDGTSYEPRMDGDVLLLHGGFKVDYTGCNYGIPTAKIHIDNHIINFGKVQLYDTYGNQALVMGSFNHNLFKKMNMHLKVISDKLEVVNLTAAENNIFYGNLIASMDSFTISGPFNNISLMAYNGAPAAKSRIYIPMSSATGMEAGAFSYASFKTYGKAQDKLTKRNRDKISINIDANINSLAEIHIVIDPASGDEIMARGSGRIGLDIPASNDISMNGIYNIDNGSYVVTFKSLFYQRRFKLNSGSTISFNGPFSETTLDVNAVYACKARLYDLLSEPDKQFVTGNEKSDAQTPQLVDIYLHMNGYLRNPKLTFDLDLDDKHSQSSLAYQKLKLINNDDRQKFNQVASLLLIGSFIPPDGIAGSSVATGAINNISQILSGSTSAALTNIISKLDKNLNVDVRYTNYNYNDQTLGGANRSEVKLGVNRSYFNDRLLVEVGGTSDWGRPTSASSTSAFNLTGDFRIQYQLSQTSGLRLNAFRTSDYDVTLDRDIVRSGVGITWRKSFDRLSDFFRGNKYAEEQKLKELKSLEGSPADTSKKPTGTE